MPQSVVLFTLCLADEPRNRVHAKYVKTCIFTFWRVGKRAFRRILQWENGKIRQKRAFSPSGEWENVHVRAAHRGCTPVPRTCKIRQRRAFSPSGEWENVYFGAFYSEKTAKYVKNVHFHPLASGK